MAKGILALVGSGEFTYQVLEIDQFLLSRLKNPRVAILPTAAGKEEDYYKWIDMGVKHFKDLGVEAVGVEILSRKDAQNPRIVKDLNYYNFFYFSGGDPGYLLDVIKDTPTIKEILENFSKGATLAACSAGAMVLGKAVFSKVYEYLATGILKPWEEGLGVVEFGVIPNFDALQKDFSNSQWADIVGNFPKDVEIIGIDENTGYILEKGQWITLGKGKVHIPAI